MQFVQGDLLVVSVGDAPKSWGTPNKEILASKSDKIGIMVLAHGTVTGNNHIVRSPGAKLYFQNDRLWLLVLTRNGVLDHEEHKPEIKINKGEYYVRRQREFSSKDVRTIQD